ncbi:hypothetical protein WJX84_001884 [Apatococcus fuscideae]|uniref:Major facilitator superfamily (MFS) profile domain-containing protein n=1 Tax=Apatococcus fuscideae TaxID=2026836 RepID=A0AAW1TG57_9CHLO
MTSPRPREHEQPLLAGNGPTAEELKSKSRTVSFGILCLCVLVVNSTFSVLSPIFPQEALKRDIGTGVVGLIFSSYSWVNFAAAPMLGTAVQRGYLTRRTLLIIGLLVVTTGCLGFGLSAKIEHRLYFMLACFFLRIFQGLGCAAVDTASLGVVISLYRETDFLGTAMGLLESALSLGWVIGPVTGGFAADIGGFGLPFFLSGGAALVFCPILLWLLPTDEQGKENDDDQPETSLIALVTNPILAVLLACPVLMAAGFTFLDPVLGPHLSADGYSAGMVGAAFGVVSAVYAGLSPFTGWLSDRLGRLPIMIAGLLVVAASYLVLGPFPPLVPPLSATSAPLLWTSMVLLGLGSGCVLVPALPALLDATSTLGFNDSGMEDLLSGTVSGAFYLGGGAAPAIAGTINAVFGFGWACTGMGFLMLLQAVALLILLLFLRTPPSRARPAAKSPFHDSSQLPEHVDEEQPHDNGTYLAGEGAWDHRVPDPPESPRSPTARLAGPMLRRTSLSQPSFKRKRAAASQGPP